MNVVLIYNVKSGGEYQLSQIRKIFKSHDIVIDYSFTARQLSSKKLAALIAKGVTVAVIGGDGTLNSVARLLVGTESVMLPLPGGTFNHFIRDLGMSPQLEDTLAHIASGKIRKIDVGMVNDELFLNNSNLGLYPFSLIERKATKKVLGKWGAALLASIDQFALFRRHKLVIDGKKVKSPFVFVGNNIYDIKQSLIPQRNSFSRGVLSVMVATSSSRLALLGAIFDVARGDVTRREDFSFSTRKSVAIYSHRASIPVTVDGELKHLTPPLEYRSVPKSLNVLVVKAR